MWTPARPTTSIELPPTRMQLRVLEFIEGHIAEHHHAPTIREICEALNIRSPNGVQGHLWALRRRGYLTWEEQQCRTLRVLRPSSPPKEVAPSARAAGGGVRVSVPDRPLLPAEAMDLARQIRNVIREDL